MSLPAPRGLSRRLKHWLHVAGAGLAIASLVFVVLRFRDYRDQLDLGQFGAAGWAGLLLLAVLVAAANLCLAMAWWRLLAFRRLATACRWALVTYGISQLAKYVPGNIAHLAGRQALGLAAGLPGWPLARVMLWELGLQAVSAMLFTVLLVPLWWPVLALWQAPALFAALLAASLVLAWRWGGPALTQALAWQVLFLLGSALVFLVLLARLAPDAIDLALLPALGGAFVVAWLVGFVTPGAPAGVGVREAVLLLLLGASLPQQPLLLAIVLTRLVTVLGDLLYFAVASLTTLRSADHAR